MEKPHDDGHDDGYDDGHDGMDALLAAILDVPVGDLSEEVRADPDHPAARADVALLREQLGLIADVLTEPAPEPAGKPALAPVRRLRPLALRVVGVAAAGALVLGGGWVVVQVGRGAADIQSSKSADDSGAAASEERAEASASGKGDLLGDPGYLACARLVAEGDVTDVVRVPGTTRERVTLHVTRSYKPEKSARPEVEFLVEDDMDPLLGEGDHVLVALGEASATPDMWAVGETDIAPERAALVRALADAEGVPCE
ncbi:hypothetical protein [Streptomyces sp. NPDC050263]|uniref:hypothetical protein n=1 Tax=Streptomyces sp. NPDC050263 TaxID=3155037 RepID=UPI00341F8C94